MIWFKSSTEAPAGSGAWTAFNNVNGNVYIYNAVADNPAYD